LQFGRGIDTDLSLVVRFRKLLKAQEIYGECTLIRGIRLEWVPIKDLRHGLQ
jgi:hypothetical protein